MYVSTRGNGLGIYGYGTPGGGGGSDPATMDPIVIDQRQGSGGGGDSGSGEGYSPEAISTYVNSAGRIFTDILSAMRGGRIDAGAVPPPTTRASPLIPVLAILGVGIGAVIFVKVLKKRK